MPVHDNTRCTIHIEKCISIYKYLYRKLFITPGIFFKLLMCCLSILLGHRLIANQWSHRISNIVKYSTSKHLIADHSEYVKGLRCQKLILNSTQLKNKMLIINRTRAATYRGWHTNVWWWWTNGCRTSDGSWRCRYQSIEHLQLILGVIFTLHRHGWRRPHLGQRLFAIRIDRQHFLRSIATTFFLKTNWQTNLFPQYSCMPINTRH